MAEAFKLAVVAGRTAYLSGAAAESQKANASSPLTGFLRNE
jgi:thiazole synthase